MTDRLLRRRAAVLVAALACVLPFGSAQAAQSGDNAATAIIEQDDGRAFDFAWDISRQRGDDPVLNHNSATSRARCARCRARAIAFQIVLVSGSPSVVVPQNTAEAVNVECTDCESVAEARQFVRVFPRPVRFTGEGRRILADVREDLDALEAQDPPIDQLHLAVETQEARVRGVLNEELVLKSNRDKEPNVLERRTLQAADLD
jgi:putative peptide zinc metalloprotease protein